MEDAFSALIRIKAEGGPSSWSYKNYNLPSRAMRQRLLLAARKLGMLCVPEGVRCDGVLWAKSKLTRCHWTGHELRLGSDLHRRWCAPALLFHAGFILTRLIGMTTIEHALPVPRLYYDVMTLFALSGTGLTPTHIVNYGGVFGEQYVWANEDIPNDPK